MKYAKDTRPKGVANKAAEVLVEALPWIKNITGKTVVIKYGGSAMVDEQLRADVMNDIVLLKIVGVNPVIVHGGGKAITEAMDFLQLPVEFKDGQRVTTPEAMDLVRTVLMGKVNQELVEALNEHGNFAVGVSGADAGVIVAEQASPEPVSYTHLISLPEPFELSRSRRETCSKSPQVRNRAFCHPGRRLRGPCSLRRCAQDDNTPQLQSPAVLPFREIAHVEQRDLEVQRLGDGIVVEVEHGALLVQLHELSLIHI